MQRKSSKSYEESLNTDFYKVNITDVAKVELYEIYFYISYYLQESRIEHKILNKIEEKCLELTRNPYRCMKVRVKPHNEIYYKLIIDNYIALYRIYETTKEVVIFRIVYAKSNYLKLE